MPARAKRIRYTFADTSFRHGRTTQQPVHAWKKVWAAPALASEEGAYTTPYKLFKWAKTGQTVVHEDEYEEIANNLTSQLPSGVTDPVPAPEQGEEAHVSVLVSPAVEDSAHNADQGASPLPADNVDNVSATQDNGVVSAENAVEAAAAAVEDVAAATYSAHAISNLIAAAELDSPAREDMSVDGDNSAPATPSAGIDPATTSLPEALLPHAAEDDGAANSFNDNQTTNPDEQLQS